MSAATLIILGSELVMLAVACLAVRGWMKGKLANESLRRTNNELRYVIDTHEKSIKRLKETVDALEKAKNKPKAEKVAPPPVGDSSARLNRLNRVQNNSRK